jgi:GT2 family glycosyltransferase
MPATPAPRLSVVIPTRDRPSRLRLTLACIARQRHVGNAQIILVNDGTSAQTQAVVAEASAHLDLVIVSGPRRGRAAARNAGAAEATAGHMVFLDDDILVGERFLDAHLAAAADGVFGHGSLREMPAAARLLAETDGAPWDELRVVADRAQTGARDRRYRLVANALERAIEAMADGTLEDVAPWLGCVGANVSMPRRAWERAGGFDEDFGLAWGCEDLELGFRLHGLGLRRVVVRSAAGVHLSHARPGRWDEHNRNMGRFVGKHPVPSVRALPALLCASGTPRGYVEAVRAASTDSDSQSQREPGAGTAPGHLKNDCMAEHDREADY